MSWWRGWAVILILLFIVQASSLAGGKRCLNYEYGKKVIAHFDPRYCKDLDQARWECDKVIFDPQVVDVKEALR